MNEKLTPAVQEKLLTLRDGTEDQKDPKKRREIIKTILIIFLAVMLVLTFFSNTIMNRSLAEVSTESVRSGKLTERVRGSGIVEANQLYEVKLDGNRTVDTIYVKAGSSVEEGDVLFTVGTGESAELSEAQDILASLELEYEKLLLTAPADYSSENQAIKNAQEDYNAAAAKLEAAITAQSGSEAAKAQYNADTAELAAKAASEAELRAAIAEIDSDTYTSGSAHTGDLASLWNTYINAHSEYETAYNLYIQLTSAGEASSSAKADADEKILVRDAAKTAYDAEKSTVRSTLAAQLTQITSDISVIQARISSYESGLSAASPSIADLEADAEAKQRTLETLIVELEKTKKQNDITSQLTSLDIEAKKTEVEKQRQKVEKLHRENAVTEIKAEYSGIISAVNIQPGDMTIPEEPVMLIDISSGGYTVKVTVDAGKAALVTAGTSAEVVNDWSGGIQAVLSDIRNDTVSGSQNKVLVFDVTGEVDSGTYLDLSIPCGSAEYQTIVPKSAVYEDSGGKFILVIQSKSSPLGNRYFARRVSVEVLASDETSSAVSVSDTLDPGAYVITAASKPVSPGDQVRMQD